MQSVRRCDLSPPAPHSENNESNSIQRSLKKSLHSPPFTSLSIPCRIQEQTEHKYRASLIIRRKNLQPWTQTMEHAVKRLVVQEAEDPPLTQPTPLGMPVAARLRGRAVKIRTFYNT